MSPLSPRAQAKTEARSTSPEQHRPRSAGKQAASPSKRKSSTGNHDREEGRGVDDDQHDIAEEKENGKKKRRKVNHACVYCRRSHMTCDLERPCARCVKRDIGHLCRDEMPTGRRHKSEVSHVELAPGPEKDKDNVVRQVSTDARRNGAYGVRQSEGEMAGRPPVGNRNENGDGDLPLPHPSPLSPRAQRPRSASTPMINNTGNPIPTNSAWMNNNSNAPNNFQDLHHLHPNYMFNNADITNEYNLLNDFLSTSLLEDGALYDSDDAQILLNDPLLTTSSVNMLPTNFNLNQPAPQAPRRSQSQQMEPTAPQSTTHLPTPEQSRNKFYMTAADPAGLSSAEDRLHKLLKAKYDAGMLKPFNYVGGYARLNTYMSTHLCRSSIMRILRQLDGFRPQFREAMQGLSDMQLVLVEMWFERALMEYDRVFAAMAIPACCWRRTGEIFRGNHEMAQLIGVRSDALRDGVLALHEILAEDSLVSYWEKFGAIAFDQTQKAILTSCVIKRVKQGSSAAAAEGKGTATNGNQARGLPKDALTESIKCCFSFTIKRDTHNIPSLIVGNFIPALPRGKIER